MSTTRGLYVMFGAAVVVAVAPSLSIGALPDWAGQDRVAHHAGPLPVGVVSAPGAWNGASSTIFARHLLPDGALDSAWAAGVGREPLVFCDRVHSRVCPDGRGGTYAASVGSREAGANICLQRYLASGAIAPGWPEAGIVLRPSRRSQYNLDLASDGSGGALVAWQDFGVGPSSRVLIQRIGPQGEPPEGWPAGGLPINTTPGEQREPHLLADREGGAFVFWLELRAGAGGLFAQHLMSNGRPSPSWPAEGAMLAVAGSGAGAPALAADSAGLVSIVWRERLADGQAQLRAARMSMLESTAPAIPRTPQSLGEPVEELGEPAIVALAGGGAAVSWAQWRAGISEVRVARVSTAGTAEATWPSDGAVACVSAVSRSAPAMLAQPDGGVLVAWEDRRGGSSDIYAQRLTASGAVAEGWPESGSAVCAAPGEQFAPALAADRALGTIVTWADASSDEANVPRSGLAANSITVAEATARPGHVHIVWQFGGEPAGALYAQRQIGPDGVPERIAQCSVDPANRVTLDDRGVAEGAEISYRLVLMGNGFEQHLAAVTLTVPAAPIRLVVRRVVALPRQNTIALSLSLPRGPAPVADLIDVMGRRVDRRTFEGLDPGEQTLLLDVPHHLASGIYFLRLTQGSEARTAKVVFIR